MIGFALNFSGSLQCFFHHRASDLWIVASERLTSRRQSIPFSGPGLQHRRAPLAHGDLPLLTPTLPSREWLLLTLPCLPFSVNSRTRMVSPAH